MPEKRLEHVVLSRLLAVVSRIDSIGEAVMSHVPKLLSMGPAFNGNAVSLSSKITQLLTALATNHEKKYVFVVIVDEAQFLDDLIKPDKSYRGGARVALRTLRSLQASLHESDSRCLLLPIACGIRPQTLLNQGTVGRHVVVQEAGFLTLRAFERSFSTFCPLAKELEDYQKALAAALKWPRMRHMPTEYPLCLESDTVCLDAPVELADSILACALTNKSMETEKIPAGFAVRP